MRNLNSFKRAGMRTVDNLSGQSRCNIQIRTRAGHHVVVVGMSRGTIHVAQALAAGAQV
jgi:hypothetical protein